MLSRAMPFAIRIIGDAVIVGLLHLTKSEKKEFPAWGRRLISDLSALLNFRFFSHPSIGKTGFLFIL